MKASENTTDAEKVRDSFSCVTCHHWNVSPQYLPCRECFLNLTKTRGTNHQLAVQAETVPGTTAAPEMPASQLGGVKSDGDKIRVDLLPFQALEHVSEVLTVGCKKYSPYNWAKGIQYFRLFRAASNHTWRWWRGEEFDPETGLHHLAHAACCILFLLHYELNKSQYAVLDDRVLLDLKQPTTEMQK